MRDGIVPIASNRCRKEPENFLGETKGLPSDPGEDELDSDSAPVGV